MNSVVVRTGLKLHSQAAPPDRKFRGWGATLWSREQDYLRLRREKTLEGSRVDEGKQWHGKREHYQLLNRQTGGRE